jgi:hypothetical protein
MALVLMLALPVALYAQEPDPIPIVDAWTDALNAGDLEGALSYLSDDAVLTFIPPPIPGDDGIFSGVEEIGGWYQGLVAANGVSTMSDCQVEAETVTCLNGYADADLEGMGVGSLEFEWVATIRDGKIQGYTVTMTPESLAKMEVAMAALPETGGVAFPSYALAIALGGLALVGGLSLALLRRRSP